MVTVTVSGSFRRHLAPIADAVQQFAELGVRVLSPTDPRVVDRHGEFLFVASDRVRSIRLVQDRHLESIRASDFLWLVCPEGYVGPSAAMELGFAVAAGVPVVCTVKPTDLTLGRYVEMAASLRAAVGWASSSHRIEPRRGLLIDPKAAVQEAHATLERIEFALESARGVSAEVAAKRVYSESERLAALLPTRSTSLHRR